MCYVKITKPTARRLYNRGATIYMVPCKCVFFAPEDNGFHWISSFGINIKDCEEEENRFDRTVNAYVYYNCNSELGYYPHYYVEEAYLKR